MVAIMAVPAVPSILDRIWYDNRPPLTIHSVRLLTPKVKPGETIQYVTTYTKRPECHPPLGELGSVSYRLDGSQGANRHTIYQFDFSRVTRWPPGKNKVFRTIGAKGVPVPSDVPPGLYNLQVSSTYYGCKGASKILHSAMPPMQIEVVKP